jgi:peptidylprolyl isomerase
MTFPKLIYSFFALFITFLLPIQGEEKAQVQEGKEELSKIDLPKVSEAFGHLIGKNLDSLGFEFDMNQVVKGLQDAMAGKESPMNETECIQAISIIQEQAFQKLAKTNLETANQFLAKNSQEMGILELEKSKLQYKVEKEGEGAIVESHFTPLIRYTGRFLDGKIFGSSQEDELISLDETIPGFSKAIIGMKEGEKRTIFIHPDLGYGTNGYLPPNSLLVFDIEVIKANVSPEQEDSLTNAPQSETHGEIASFEEKEAKEIVR